jgi:predicted phosphodiesterase
MRILVLSDLHLEFAGALEHFRVPPDLQFDAVILAGDIHSHTRGIDWAARTFAGKHIIYVAGNHEYYGAHLHGLTLEMRKVAARLGVHYLEQDEVVIDGLRILGTTLWTDFALFGADMTAAAMRQAANAMPDFRVIRVGASHGQAVRANRFETWHAGILQPADTVQLFGRSRKWLADKLAERFDGKTVVVTHHLPSDKSVARRFEADPVCAAFASRLDDLVVQADLWVHGHTHDSFDYALGSCRVVCNPRGYPRSGKVAAANYCGDGRDRADIENPAFRDDLVVDC